MTRVLLPRGLLHAIVRQGRRWQRWAAALCLAMGVCMSPVFAQSPRLLDGFEDLAPWQVGAADGVRASLHAVAGLEGQALCLDFDFAGGAGYASARRALRLDFPPTTSSRFTCVAMRQ